MNVSVRPLGGQADLEAIRGLMAEYLAIQVDNYPDPQAVARHHREELAGLPGPYSPPGGALFIGLAGDQPAGCVALRPQSDGVAEMKRLFVRDDFRGFGLGRRLAEAVVDAATQAGNSLLRLDVHVSRLPAIALYHSLGFSPVEPWEQTPFELLFMEKVLRST
jgi:GNAT superfamily N-acetyltransferase